MAMIVDALAEQVVETLVTMAKEEVTMMLNVKDDLRRLKTKVVFINSVLEDAERKALGNTANANAIRVWLAELKDVLYDAVDVIDLRRTRVEQLKRLSPDGWSWSVPCHSSFFFSCVLQTVSCYQTGHKIRGINGRLEGIIKDQSDFRLIPADAAARDNRGSSSSSIIHRQTDPLLEPDIVGMQINNDTSRLVDLLLMNHCVPAVSVLAIVGMGGIGKTTLAQKVFNHPTVKDNFRVPPPMWVCVSQNYSATGILKEVIQCAGGDPNRAQSFSGLVPLLAEVIEQKKFLLILDDVWSARVWEEVMWKPLQRAAAGSRILITTRDENVAKSMGAVHLHPVRPLPDKDGWLLLSNKVLQGGGEEGLETVEDIGVQIVKKCHGLPLAIKTIAGVLMVKDRTQREWERVLNNPAWSLTDLAGGGGVMGALYLSFQDLPSHLKQCFVFCSLFPEDFQIKKNELTAYWIAHGFVEAGGDMMEDVAEGYYKELISRSLLQPHPDYYDYRVCTMHDLLRSLAQFLAGDDIFTGDMEGWLVKASASAAKIRHLFLIDHNQLDSVPDHESLRTLHIRSSSLVDFAPHVFEKLRHLRLLQLNCENFRRLPETVENLVHLRILDLAFTSITELPESIGSLSNLQYLHLEKCSNLHSLPKGVTELYNLRGLNAIETLVEGMPTGIGRLQHLRNLCGFVTNDETINGNGRWCSMEELRSLSQLRILYIQNLERAVVMAKARGFLLKDMRHLYEMRLNCTLTKEDMQAYGGEEVERIQKIFEEELYPPNSLEILEINSFFGLKFPRWMTSSVLSNLRLLELNNCHLCKQLPPLGQLPNLDTLTISDASAVEIVGAEFFGPQPSPYNYMPFPKLNILTLINFPNWVEWLWEHEDDGEMAMPRLRSLLLIWCPRLSSLPKGLLCLTNLHTLLIVGADILTVVENLMCIKKLVITYTPNLVRLSNLPALQELIVEECPALRDMGVLYSLKYIEFKDLAMESLPDWLMLREGGQQSFPALELLHITVRGVPMLQRCLQGGLDWPKIHHFSSVLIKVYERPEFLFYNRDPFTLNINMGASIGDGSGGSDIGHHD